MLIFSLFTLQVAFGNEIIRSFEIKDSNPNLKTIALNFEIKERFKDKFIVFVLDKKEAEFKKLAPLATLVNSNINSELQNHHLFSEYRSYEEANNDLKNLLLRFPKLMSAQQYGESHSGKPLLAFKMQQTDDLNRFKPKVIITAATHGDELITVKTIFHLMEKILNNPSILENINLYFIPMVNPDGFSKRSRYSDNGFDPNRQYPWPEQPVRDIKVPAIKHLINYFEKEKFSGSMDIHASGQMIMYPWAYTYDKPESADDLLFDNLTTKMGAPINYKHGQISKVIYVAKGSSADFYYWKHNTIAVAIEVGKSKYPRGRRIQPILKNAEHFFQVFLESFSK